MLTTEILSSLKSVFSDADLVDIDCSQWDTEISLFVIADHVPSSTAGKRSLMAVRFLGVTFFEWKFNHVHFSKFPLKHDADTHLVWNIYQGDVRDSDVANVIVLSGSEQFPVLRIEFEDVKIEPIPHSVFATVNPCWSNLSLGLGRPGIERLFAIVNERVRGEK